MLPPNKKSQPQAGAASSVSTSNETSFAFLGARRLPWMTSGVSAAPAPRSNDDDSTRADARATPRAKQPTATNNDAHAPPGGSAAPTGAQAGYPGAQGPERRPRETHSSAVVLPSPALSSEPNSAASTPVPAESTCCANGPAGPERHASASAVPPTWQARVPFSASGILEPSGATRHPVAQDTTQRTSQVFQGSQTGATPGAHAPESSVPSDLPTPPRPLTREPAATSLAATKRAAPAPEEIPQGEHPLGRRGVDEASDGRRKRSRIESGSHQPVQSFSPQSVKTVLDEWLERIEHRLDLYRAPGSLTLLERPRYKLLCDACVKADPLYIVLHQVFCIWSVDRNKAYALLGNQPRVVDASFDLLLCALRSNTELSPTHLEWFSSFPLSVDGTGASFSASFSLSIYTHVLTQVNVFVTHFATGWGQLLATLDSRKYPLMIWELRDTLKCGSPVLQEILFTSSRRKLASDASAPGTELQRVFALDRKNESRSVDSAERDIARANLAERYRNLILATLAEPGQAGYCSTSTTASNPALGMLRSSLDVPGSPMASHPVPPAQHTQLPMMQHCQAPSGAIAYPSSPHLPDSSRAPIGPTFDPRFVLRSNTDDIDVSRPSLRPTAVAPSPQTLAQQSVAWQPTLPRITGMGQLAVSTPTLMHPDHAARVLPHPRQTWQPTQQPTQYAPDPSWQHRSPLVSQGTWSSSHGFQQDSNAVSPYPLGFQHQSVSRAPFPPSVQQEQQSSSARSHSLTWNTPHPQQTAPVAWQPTQPRSNNAFRPPNPAAAQHYSPLSFSPPVHQTQVQPNARAVPEQLRPRPPANPAQSQHETVRLLETEYPQNEHDWTSLRQGLHLVHLRSPKRVPSELRGIQTQYYQFVSHFAVEPRAVLAKLGLGIMEFCMSQKDLSKVVRTSDSSTPPLVLYSCGSLRYRLRLCRAATPEMRLSDWSITPNFWPPHIFVTFNGRAVQPRRRQHFHHDLPMELSNMLKIGENIVKISLPAVAANVNKVATCHMAVEVVSTLDYAAVRSLIDENQHYSADDTRREIARRLSLIDSDDVIVEDDVLCVSVADPFSSILFTVPVRGVSCKHIECFDLEIWLDTRRGKPSHGQGEPSLVDDWKCPICGLDARPVSLRVDDYFAQVRQKLIEDGCGGTKKIRIKADGSWTAIQESDEVEVDDERWCASEARASPRAERIPNRDTTATPIIILDDD